MDTEAYIKTMVSREGEVVELKPEIKFKENPKFMSGSVLRRNPCREPC